MSNRTYKLLSSLELAVVLLLVIAAVSAIGTVFDLGPGAPPAQYEKAFGTRLYGLADALGFTAGRMYASVWFNALLGLFLVNLSLCGFNWLPRTLRAVQPAPLERDIEAVRRSAGAVEIAGADADLSGLEGLLRRRGFEVRREASGDGAALVAERGRFGHWGFFLTHVAFVVIASGAISGRLLGEKGMVVIDEGGGSDIVQLRAGGERRLPFALFLDDFRMEYYSDLVVSESGAAAPVRKTVEAGGVVRSPSGRHRVRVVEILPDAVLAPDGSLHLRSRDFNMPAMTVSIEGRGAETETYVLFAADPAPVSATRSGLSLRYEIDNMNPPKEWTSSITVLENGRPVGRKDVRVNHPLDFGGWRFYQSGYDQEALRYTVLEATRDPGVPFVYLGCILLVVGPCLTLYVSHRRIRAVVTRAGDRSTGAVAGDAGRDGRAGGEWLSSILSEYSPTGGAS